MQKLISEALFQIGQVVIGKSEQIKLAMACLLAKGHLLIEDLPGMGKTTLAHTLAATLNLSYQRSQFTSDLLPADVVGVSIFDSTTNEFTLHKGPIFNQVVLADEINRASPKTQSALLEAMEENRVSIDGTTYDLPAPFFVIATQNPMFHAGTYPLPESQLDRFMMRISLGFPNMEAEKQILANEFGAIDYTKLNAFITTEQLVAIQNDIQQVFVSPAILDYVVALLTLSRQQSVEVNPLSPRAGKSLLSAAKAWAYIEGRDHVLPNDIQAVFVAVCQHRLSQSHDVTSSNAIGIAEQLLSQVDTLTPLAGL